MGDAHIITAEVILPRGSKNPTGGSTPSSSSKDIFKDAPERATRPAGAKAAAGRSQWFCRA